MIIKVQNDQVGDDTPRSQLAATMDAGTTTITVKNSNSFTNGWAAQFGKTGEERAEIKVINSVPASNSFTIASGLTYEHPPDTPIFCIKYDKIYFKASTVGTTGVVTTIADGTVAITPDSSHTQFDYTAGSTSYGYKTSFFSTGLAAESADSDWFSGSGSPFYSLVRIRERSRRKMLNSDSITDDQIDDWTNEWLERMTNTAIDVNEDYALGTAEISFSGTVQQGTITVADFKQVRRAWHTDTGSTWYRMTKQELTDYYPDETFSDTNPFYNMKGDNVIERQPHDTSGTIGLTYYKLNAILDSDGDELPVAMRGYTSSFVKYNEAQAKKKDNKQQEAERLEAQAEFDRQKFEKEISNRNKSGPTTIKIIETIGEL